MHAGFSSGFHSRGDKHIAANFKGGEATPMRKANFQGGGGAPPGPSEITPVYM